MKRELKVAPCAQRQVIVEDEIARPIPMKRELKVRKGDVQRVAIIHCKAHPDEKGTERIHRFGAEETDTDCKAHPDEKGTERLLKSETTSRKIIIARPIPMKRELKGKKCRLYRSGTGLWIARPIPMKRELKVAPCAQRQVIVEDEIARPIPMKRELKGGRRRLRRVCPQVIARPIPMKRELKAEPRINTAHVNWNCKARAWNLEG